METTTRQHVSMLSADVAEQLRKFHWRWSFVNCRCLMKNDDHGPRGANPPVIPYAPVTRGRVFTGTRESGSYNHHSQLARFKGRYYLAWSNGIVDEAAQGQRILICSSDDAADWSEPVCVAGDRPGSLVKKCVGLLVADDAMYILAISEDCITDASAVGMRRTEPGSIHMEAYASTDGVQWEKAFAFKDGVKLMFEAPRLTSEGRLLCICTTLNDGPAALLWQGNNVCEDPEVIAMSEPEGASFPHGEASWFQTDAGRIIVFWRDEAGSCRLYVTYSDDGGETFAPPMMSDIPDSMSRVYAGRLADGRYYLCNNAFPTLLDRMHLMLLLSDDGETFNKVYTLVDDPTSQRLKGLLKADGYQYPCCLAEEDRLLVGHSVNKEDIECGIVECEALR